MTTWRLERFAACPWGVFGRLFIPGQVGDLWTVERSWLDNKPFVSCIPAGLYKLHNALEHRRLGPSIRVEDVPGRTGILLHRANVPSELSGCIGVGLDPQAFVKGQWGVGSSREAMEIVCAARAAEAAVALSVEWAKP